MKDDERDARVKSRRKLVISLAVVVVALIAAGALLATAVPELNGWFKCGHAYCG